MTTELAARNGAATLSLAVEKALLEGDLGQLAVEDRLQLYHQICADLGLNPRTRPFAYIWFTEPGSGGKRRLQLYAQRNATDQLARNYQLNQQVLKVETVGDIYIVHARVTSPDGRSTDNIGAVAVEGKRGDALANAFKKGVTQAYRRAVLSHVGLSFLDETEAEQVRGAETVAPDELDAEPGGEEAPALPPAPVQQQPSATKKELLGRFARLAADAQQRGIGFEALDGDEDDAALAQRIAALASAINERTAKGRQAEDSPW